MASFRFAWVSGLFLIVINPSLHANVFDTYGQDAGSVALGNATTASGSTAYAAYSNPASLTQSAQNEVASHLMLTRFDLHALPSDRTSSLPSDRSRSRASEGASLGIHLKLSETLHFGLAAYMPQGEIGRVRGLSSREASYLRYDDQQQKPVAYTALGWRLNENFSLGAGAYYSLRARGNLLVALDSKRSESRLDLTMEPVVVPYGGMLWHQGPWKVGLTYREAQQSANEVDASFALSTDDMTIPFTARSSLVAFYDPAQVRLGVAWEGSALALFAAFEKAQWARYRSPIVRLNGPDVAALSAEDERVSPRLRDTEAYRLGAALPLPSIAGADVDLRAGYEYHTSANRDGRPGLVIDPKRQVLALGSVWVLPAAGFGRSLSLEGAYQLSYLARSIRVSSGDGSWRSPAGSTLQTFLGGLNYAL